MYNCTLVHLYTQAEFRDIYPTEATTTVKTTEAASGEGSGEGSGDDSATQVMIMILINDDNDDNI